MFSLILLLLLAFVAYAWYTRGGKKMLSGVTSKLGISDSTTVSYGGSA
jgi:hypothetical protein